MLVKGIRFSRGRMWATGLLVAASGCKILAPDEPVVTAISVTSIAAAINTGQATIVSAEGRAADGTVAPVEVNWSVTGGTISPLTGASAQFTASTAGDYSITATAITAPFPEGSTSVAVIAQIPPTVSITISPFTASLNTGGARQFSAIATRQDSSTYVPDVTYSATGGTIMATGLYTAGPTAGTFKVIVVQQGSTLADTATVTILAATLQAVFLTPTSIALNSGATQQFAVSGQWSNGATTAPAVTYSATGGTVTPSGLYTAGITAGTFRVIAKQQGGTIADTSTVTITAPVLQAVILSPSSVSLNPALTQQFSVNGQWSNGTTTAPSVTYSATGGTITAGGLYTAGATAGTYRVIAVQVGGTLADTSVVTVTPPPVPGANPNEPAGMTVAFNEAWNTSPNGRTGIDWITDGPGDNFSIVSDATALKTPNNVLQVLYPAGFGAGYSPAQAYYGYNGSLPANTGTLYVRTWIKISSNWTDNGNSGTKFFFVRPWAGEDGGPGAQTNHLVALTDHGELDVGFVTQGPSEVEYHTGANLTKGVWHDIEILLTMGSSGSANDGTVKIWADGARILNLTGVKMLYNGQNVGAGWKYLFLDPTYGGGVNKPPADLNFRIDHWYASVK